jgi:hypothetical protein
MKTFKKYNATSEKQSGKSEKVIFELFGMSRQRQSKYDGYSQCTYCLHNKYQGYWNYKKCPL